MTQDRITRAKEDVILAARQVASRLLPMQVGDYATLVAAVRALDNVELQAIGDENGPHNGIRTSAIAAAMSGPMAGTVRRGIVDEIRCTHESLRGLTTDELEVALRRSHTTVSSAVNHLCRIGWLRDSGYERDTRAGRPAIVYELTPLARDRLET